MGAFGKYTENAKDQIINLIRDQFKIQGIAQEEMPTMEKFNFYSDDPYETFVRVLVSLPDIDQQLPLVAVTIGTAAGLPMGIGIGGDYVGMFQDSDGYYQKIYSSRVNMTINVDVGTEDTNTRSEITDIILSIIQFYLRDSAWELNAPEESTDAWQMIFDREINLSGEQQIPKPEADPEDKIYVQRMSFNVTYIDYVSRLAAGQGKTGPGVPESHKGPIQVVPDTNPPPPEHYYPNLRWTKD
jgi:hypothetical protein